MACEEGNLFELRFVVMRKPSIDDASARLSGAENFVLITMQHPHNYS